MDRRVLKQLTRMEKQTGNGLFGMSMRMDRRKKKELTRMEKKTGNGLIGGTMERRGMKKLTRMGPIIMMDHPLIGMKTKEAAFNIIKYTVKATRTSKKITYFRGV